MAEPAKRAEPSGQTGQGVARGIDGWCRKLMGADTPIFAKTVSEVTAVTGDEATSAADLSKVVGHDASMASRLLRIAGSSLFNLQGRKIETISAAIVLIGFDAVRELAVSLALIEHVLQGRQHHRVTKHMGRAFHAAAQAKSFATLGRDKCPEEVFVAALLRQLGDMSFWAQGSREGVEIERLVDAGLSMDSAERQVLGFSMKELTCRLAEEWHLGELLRHTVDGRHAGDPRVAHVDLGHEVAEVIELHGWESPEARSLLSRVASQLQMAPADAERLVRNNLEEASAIADRYGVPKVDEALPPLPSSGANPEPPESKPGEPDPHFRDQVFAALAEQGAGRRSLNESMHLILRGIFEGLGVDRTWFALLTPDRKALQARYVLGRNPEQFSGSSRPLRAKGDLFSSLLAKGEAVTMTPGDRAAQPDYVGWLAYSACAIMPIIVAGKPVGLLYADRAASRRAIDEETFAGFCRFGEEIVQLLSGARR